jgi:hypothetical protein
MMIGLRSLGQRRASLVLLLSTLIIILRVVCLSVLLFQSKNKTAAICVASNEFERLPTCRRVRIERRRIRILCLIVCLYSCYTRGKATQNFDRDCNCVRFVFGFFFF